MRMLDNLKARHHRVRFRAAMLRAIDAACERSAIWGHANRPDGLRAIRALERLSGSQFDPFNPILVSVVRGEGAKQRQIKTGRCPAR